MSDSSANALTGRFLRLSHRGAGADFFDGENIDDIVLLASSSTGVLRFPESFTMLHRFTQHSIFMGAARKSLISTKKIDSAWQRISRAHLLTCCSRYHKVASVRVQKSAGKISMPACSLATGEWPPWNRTYSTSEASKEKHQKD